MTSREALGHWFIPRRQKG